MKKSYIQLVSVLLILLAFTHTSFGQSLSAAVPPGFKFAHSDRLPIIAMPAINVDSMLAEDAIEEQHKGTPYRFGYNHLVYYKPENSGTWTDLPNGDRIWQLDVKTPGSFSVNLAFSGFHLPAGAKLFIYSKDHEQVEGPYTSANNTPDNFFGSELIRGDETVLEYYEPQAVRGQSSFILFRITQGYKDLVNYLKSDGFGTAGSCMHNVNCPQYYAYATQKRAVVCILSNGNALCSGALVNNTLNDGTPYVLTANHCGTSADGSWVFRFNWEAPGCQNPSVSPPYQSLHGATAVAFSGVSDFNLVKIDTAPPASFHAFYAGWNYGLTPATSVACIHHPSGDIKKISLANNPVTDTFYDAGNGVAQAWQIGRWTDGATEAGSSGSPLFDQNKRIVGQLYGGPSACGVPADQLRDYYGRFNVSWDSGSTPQTRLKDWLDPNNSSNLTNDGYDPYPLIDSVDVALISIISPVGTSCSTTVNPSVNIFNVGTSTDSNIIIHYHIDNAGDSTFTWTGVLAPQTSVTINLGALSTTPGAHTFFANANVLGAVTDQNLYNDSLISSFVIFNTVSTAAPLVEGFESGSFPPSGWLITTPPSGATWALNTNGGFGTSAHSAFVDEFSPSSSTVGETPTLISPPVNMNGIQSPSYLSFDVAYAAFNAFQTDTLIVFASTDCGTTWTKLYQKGGDSLATAPYANSLFVPSNTQWRKDYINITSLVGQSNVIFEFEMLSGFGNALYVDNIDIADTTGPAGIANLDDNMSIRVFPNPFAQSLSMLFNLDATKNISAGVYSADGKKLITVLDNERVGAGNHQLEINTSQLSNGVYILKVNERFFKLEKLK